MSFATDRDLVVLEPNLFRDIAWSGQRRLSATDAATVGNTLTSASSDFQAAGVTAGHIATLDSTTIEIISRDSSTQLTVSMLRDDPADPPLAPPAVTAAALDITTFGPQIAHVHDQLLRALGIEPTDPAASPGPSDITNPAAIARLEALGALHLIFAAAAALATDQDRLWIKAQLHRDRFIALRNRLRVGVDLDGDGQPDAIRQLNTIQFLRG